MHDLQRLKIGYDVDTKMGAYIPDRYTHILLVGKSGTGKSTSILNWWDIDELYSYSKILIEPSGFLARDCYSISQGIYCSLSRPISINPMMSDYSPSQISDIVAEAVNQVISICTPNERLSVKMRTILDTAIKECLKRNRFNLLNVRDYIANLRGDGETRDGILARLNFLLSDERMIKILCGNNSVKWGELISKRKTFIMDCSAMGKDKMVFVGNLITQGLTNYFRYERPEKYMPVSLFVDECHNFVSPNIFDILKEGRKYKISCVLSTQDLALFDPKLTRTMLNVGNIVSYRLGSREASLVSNELMMDAEQVQKLEKYHVAYINHKGKGIAKASRPPLVIDRPLPKMEEPQRKTRPSWFAMGSC